MIRALLGGSFDPVHVGHVAMARHVLSSGLAEIVHIVPAWLSPHKNHTTASAADRLAMVNLAFGKAADLVIDPREIDSGRICYTVDTLTELLAEYPADEWLLVIGGDNLTGFHRWHEAERLQTMAKILVLGRAGQDLSPDALRRAGLDESGARGLPDFDQPVSSTSVRVMLANGPDALSHLTAAGLPAPVAEYILAHEVYSPNRL